VYEKGFKEVSAGAGWTSEDPEIATVDADGTITIVVEGVRPLRLAMEGEIQLKIGVSE
jgi:uncharacterized protein YjdB